MAKRLLSALIVALGLIGIAGGEAQAVVITVDSQSYRMTTVASMAQGFDDVLRSQPWFGDFDLTVAFVLALGDQLGMPNNFFGSPAGPLFIGFIPPTGSWIAFLDTGTGGAGAGIPLGPQDGVIVAVTVPLPEPATLALFGLGLAGLGLAVRRRRAVSLR